MNANPLMYKMVRHFDDERVADVEAAAYQAAACLCQGVKPGQSIAIAVGSRGVANLPLLVKGVVRRVKDCGAHPFIIPAMGSHGGATAEGQREVLAFYGVTEELVGAPVRSSMDVVELPPCPPVRTFMDKLAYESDGVIVINRVKVHTDFHGPYESGMMKMCVIGLGKHRQALETHRYGVHGLRDLMPQIAKHILAQGKVLGGIGTVENAYDHTMFVRGFTAEQLPEGELEMIELCRKVMPSLPVDEADILIVDALGKDYSGTGLDTNIIGRMGIQSQQDGRFNPTRIIVTDVSEGSHGNAIGMGLADFMTRRLYDKIDWAATYENVLTSTFTDRGRMPMMAETDQQAYRWALRTCGPVTDESLRVIRIKNTLNVYEMYVSKPLWEELRIRPDMEDMGETGELFDAQGELNAF